MNKGRTVLLPAQMIEGSILNTYMCESVTVQNYVLVMRVKIKRLSHYNCRQGSGAYWNITFYV